MYAFCYLHDPFCICVLNSCLLKMNAFKKIFLLSNAHIAVNIFLQIGHSSAELFQSYLKCRASPS